MSKHWICNTKCYVPVGGKLRLWSPGDPAEGEIAKTSRKYFDIIGKENESTKERVKEKTLTKKELKRILNKKGIKYFKGASEDKLRELLTKAESAETE